MSDSETYFSESEDDIVNTQNDPEEDYESGEDELDEIDELDEETKNILQKHYLRIKTKKIHFLKILVFPPYQINQKRRLKNKRKKYITCRFL